MSKIYCDRCGAEVKKNDDYCDNCGLSFVDDNKKENKLDDVQKTIDGLSTLGDIIKVLLIIAAVILFIMAILQFNHENESIGVSLVVDALIFFGLSFVCPLTFYWLSYILDDIHAIRKKIDK